MRTFLVVLAVLVLVSSGSLAASKSAVSFAIKGGINPADQVLNPDPETQDGKFLRFGGGATLGFEFTPNVSLDTDFLYMMKGGKYKFEASTVYGDALVETQCALDYIVVNPMLRFTPRTNGPSPYFMVGPEFGFLVKAEWTYDPTPGEKSTTDASNEFKDTDMALNFGAGLDFPTEGTMSFFFEGRYSLGLSDVNEPRPETDPIEIQKDSVKNRGIYIFAGFRF